MNVWSHGTVVSPSTMVRIRINSLSTVTSTWRFATAQCGCSIRNWERNIFSIHDSGGLYIRRDKLEMDQVGENYLFLSVGTGISGDVRQIRGNS